MKRYSYVILSMFIAMTVLTGCHDDEPEIQEEDNATQIEFPTEDVITNTYAGNYAIIGSEDYDEATHYVLKRLTGARNSYSPTGGVIADDVRLVFINNDALLSLEKPMVMQLKKVVENGGYIYVHKPNPFAIAFLAIAIYADIDEAMDDLKQGCVRSKSRAETDAPISYDTYIMGPENRQLFLMDIYDGKTITVEMVDTETGEQTTEEYHPKVPDPYEYGRFAENIIEWLKEDFVRSHSRIFSRAGEDVLDNASDMKVIIPCKIEQPHYSKTFDASCRVWVSDLYNFDKDEDYYHIVLEESFDGRNCYAGQYYVFKDGFGVADKYAGFPYSHLFVRPSFQNKTGKNGKMKDAWNPQPENEGVTSMVENVTGWSFNSEVGFSGGLAALFSGGYRNEQTVKTIDKSITPHLLKGDTQFFYWEYILTNELCYKHKKGDPFGIFNGNMQAPSSNSLTINTCRTRQSWNWLVSGTKNRGNEPFNLQVNIIFWVLKAQWTGGAKTKQIRVNSDNEFIDVELPVPNRFKNTYSMSCENAVLSEWTALKEEIISHDRENFSKLNATRCAPTEELVDRRTAELWNKTIQGVAARVSTFNHLEKDEYVIVLKNNEGKVIGKKLIVTTSGARVQ